MNVEGVVVAVFLLAAGGGLGYHTYEKEANDGAVVEQIEAGYPVEVEHVRRDSRDAGTVRIEKEWCAYKQTEEIILVCPSGREKGSK